MAIVTTTSSSQALDYFKRAGSAIAAVATALGGPLAVIRVSGKSLTALREEFSIPDLDRTIAYRKIFGLDEGLVLFFKNPKSFTGEDVLEFQVHGSSRTCELILEKLCQRNCLRALPGEFSFRAFLNQKMTLAEAEALHLGLTNLADSSQSPELLNLSDSKQQETQKLLENLAADLTSARGRLESAIDFSEAVEEQQTDLISSQSKLKTLGNSLDKFLTYYQNFSTSWHTPKVLLVGVPNAGKSSLLNLLVGAERSLVSSQPGTTRDYIEAAVTLKNKKFLFIDSAGIREIGGALSDEIESRGIENAIELIGSVQAVIWVRPTNDPADSQANSAIAQLLSSHKKVFVVESFGDKGTGPEAVNLLCEADKLRKILEAKLIPAFSEVSGELEYFLSERQFALLKDVEEKVVSAARDLDLDLPMELVAEKLRDADASLKKCSGRELSDDYIGAIFSQFCLGK